MPLDETRHPNVYGPNEPLPEPGEREPVFGAGWPLAGAFLVLVVVAAVSIHWAGRSIPLRIIGGLASIAVAVIVYAILSALVSDRQLRVPRPPPGPYDQR